MLRRKNELNRALLLLVAFLLVNAPNCHLSLVLASVVQSDAVNCNTTLLQPHRTVVANFAQVISVCFGGTPEPLAATRGTMVEKHCPNVIKFHEHKLRPV